MPIIEHGELFSRALDYIREEHASRPDVPLAVLIDEAGMRFNLSPLDSAQLARLFDESGPDPLRNR